MRRTRRALGLAALVLLGIAIFTVTREEFLKRRLIAFAEGNNTKITIERVFFSGRALVAKNVIAHWGREGEQRRVRINLARVVLRPAWWRLLYFRFRVARLEVVTPQVTWIDDADGRPSVKPKGAFDRPAVEVDEFEVSNGTFTFVRLSKNTRAVIGLREIRGRVAAFGTSKERRDDPVTGEIDAQLGFSGQSHLSFTARPTARETNADVRITMKNQNLKDLGEFFEPNVGLRIGGVIERGRSHSKMRGNHLTTHLDALFDNLTLKVLRTEERGAWSALFTNLGLALGMKGDNKKSPRSEQARTVETTRAADDSLISFFLRGLKDAAMSAAEKPAARALTE